MNHPITGEQMQLLLTETSLVANGQLSL